MEKVEIELKNKLGLHARPIAKLVKLSEQLSSTVKLQGRGNTADISNIYELMAMGLQCGDQVEICVDGAAAGSDLVLVQELFDNNFGEE